MPYDEQLLERVRAVFADRSDVTEQRMFGSVAFMVKRRMACGPHKDSLIVRIGEEAVSQALLRPHVRPMDFTGRVMKAFVTIDAEGLRSETQLRHWVELASGYADAQSAAKTSKKRNSTRPKRQPRGKV